MNSTSRILCSKCQQFYGSQATQGFCSVCFKTECKPIDQIQKKEDLLIQTEDKKEENIIESRVDDLKGSAKPVQLNKDICWKCSKRVGYLGFSCKCGYIFCGVHRHFTEHNCDYDYKTVERERLMKDNPLVSSKKI
jgi:hypothetical protein